jgi:hypothetical protein
VLGERRHHTEAFGDPWRVLGKDLEVDVGRDDEMVGDSTYLDSMSDSGPALSEVELVDDLESPGPAPFGPLKDRIIHLEEVFDRKAKMMFPTAASLRPSKPGQDV